MKSYISIINYLSVIYMTSFFKKADSGLKKAFSKGEQKRFFRKLNKDVNREYQESIPAVRAAGQVAGNLAPAAMLIPGYGPGIAVGLKGAQGVSKVYTMGEDKHFGKPKLAVMPRNSIQAPKPAEEKPDVFY